jgi:hypothetical protein
MPGLNPPILREIEENCHSIRVSRANIYFSEDPADIRRRRRGFGGGSAVFPRGGGESKAGGVRTIV